MWAYLLGIWRCRYFWVMLVKNDLRQRYRRSLLGLGWSLLQPVAMTCIICFFFQAILMQSDNVASFAAHVLAGLACWNYIVTATLHGCQCLYLGETYIRQYPAPMAIYPLRTALGGTFHFLIATCLVVLLCWGINGFGNLLVLPALALSLVILFVVTWSLAVLAGFANVYFQDTQHLCEVGFQILFYLSPILFPAEVLQQRGLGWILDYNPMTAMLALIRDPVLEARAPTAGILATATLTTAIAAGAASFILSRCQRRLIFQL